MQFTHMIGLLVLLVGFMTSFSHPTSSWAGVSDQESLKRSADGLREKPHGLKVGSLSEPAQTTS
ncbi:MAG: hypothetical protein OJF50_002742 [Nitrospira sp.]|jgi:hypothetical protein|nr:hypothetical protein [Nitrospira sp.]